LTQKYETQIYQAVIRRAVNFTKGRTYVPRGALHVYNILEDKRILSIVPRI